MLLQPKNDHLLFAFFGISLQLRKRSAAVAIRSRVAMKRKIDRLLTKRSYAPFLLRDPNAEKFPYITKGETPRWMIRNNRGMDFRGIGFHFKEYVAYIQDDGRWDMANKSNRAIVEYDNPWAEFERRQLSTADKAELSAFVDTIPLTQRAQVNVIAYVPFEQIIAIDEVGDECWDNCRGMPVLYVPINDGQMDVHPDVDVSLRGGIGTDPVVPDSAKRIKFFPAEFRDDEQG